MQIRRALATDRDALYDICVRTADFGRDGRHLYEDHELPGHMWAGAYLALEPRLAFVVADDDGVAGYVIGARHLRVRTAPRAGLVASAAKSLPESNRYSS